MPNELATYLPKSAYPRIPELKDFAAAVSDNLGGQEIGFRDLQRIKVPGSGGLSFKVSSPNGDEEKKEVSGIMIYRKMTRAYWPKKIEEGGLKPPQCSSDDAVYGVGNPGGECDKCPCKQFGSAANGRAQACKEIHHIYILTPGSLLPTIVSAPPTSLDPLKKYLVGLASEGKSMFSVQTTISLKSKPSAIGQEYSYLVFKSTGNLDKESIEMVSKYREALLPQVKKIRENDEGPIE